MMLQLFRALSVLMLLRLNQLKKDLLHLNQLHDIVHSDFNRSKVLKVIITHIGFISPNKMQVTIMKPTI